MAQRGRPATGVTPKQGVRIPQELWDAAIEEAHAEGSSVAKWVNEDLQKRVNAARRRRAREDRQGE